MNAPAADPALLDEAVLFTRAAGELTLTWHRSTDLAIDAKGDGTPVTEADRAAERFLRETITEKYPADAVGGEEEADREGTSGRLWMIDPIDGTKAFTRGLPHYSNLLAVSDEYGPAIGVINLPALGETVYAGRGLGCFCNGKPVTVSHRDGLEGALLVTSGLSDWDGALFERVRDAGVTLRTWGDGYGYALVATGRAEAMVDRVCAVWDVSPMPVILAEAGGRFTDLAGADRVDGGTGLGTNARRHDEWLALFE